LDGVVGAPQDMMIRLTRSFVQRILTSKGKVLSLCLSLSLSALFTAAAADNNLAIDRFPRVISRASSEWRPRARRVSVNVHSYSYTI